MAQTTTATDAAAAGIKVAARFMIGEVVLVQTADDHWFGFAVHATAAFATDRRAAFAWAKANR